MCSCFIPVYCGYDPPLFHGVAYVDAALSNNSPWLDEDTVTVAPFSGKSSICPENDGIFYKSFSLSNTSIGLTAKNLYMLFRVLFPGAPDIQKDLCQKGYNDALRFMRDNDLIPCPDCVADPKKSPKHGECKTLQYTMPKEISDEIGAAIEKFQKNLGYRLFQYRSMKLLYYMNMPSIVTAKLSYVVLTAILQKVQSKAGSCVDDLWSHFLQILKEGIQKQNYYPKLPCHVEPPDNGQAGKSDLQAIQCDADRLTNDDSCYTTVKWNKEENPNNEENLETTNVDVKLNVTVQRMPDGSYHCKSSPLQKSINKVPFSLREGESEVKMNDVFNSYIY